METKPTRQERLLVSLKAQQQKDALRKKQTAERNKTNRVMLLECRETRDRYKIELAAALKRIHSLESQITHLRSLSGPV